MKRDYLFDYLFSKNVCGSEPSKPAKLILIGQLNSFDGCDGCLTCTFTENETSDCEMTDEMIEYATHLEYYGASREDADACVRREFA